MALAIAGPTDGRVHRDDLRSDERIDAAGAPLPPLPGYGTLPSAALSLRAPDTNGPPALEGGRSQDVRDSAVASSLAIIAFLGVIGIVVIGGIMDGFSIWDWSVIGLAALAVVAVVAASIVAFARH